MDYGCIKLLSLELRVNIATAPELKLGYFASSLHYLGSLGSIVVEPTYLFCVSAAYFYSTDPEMATIVHRACSDHPKFFCGLAQWG